MTMMNRFSRMLAEAYKAMAVSSTSPVGKATARASVVIPTINIINKSTILKDREFNAMVDACSQQMELHVAPVWMKGPWTIVKNQPESVGYPIVILDNPDQAGALGYHTESPGGKVWGRVFVKPVLDNKGTLLRGSLSVSAVLSHEIIEAYIDPNVNMWASRSDGLQVAYEAADPVENDAYDIVAATSGLSVSVSNFVYPAWFDSYAARDAKFDYMGTVARPFAMSRGGYMVTLNPRTGQVRNIFGSVESEKKHWDRQDPYPAARSMRKTTGAKNLPVEEVETPDVPVASVAAAAVTPKSPLEGLVLPSKPSAPEPKTDPAAPPEDKSGK